MILPNNPNESVTFDDSRLSEIVLAGGCFWGTQAYIRRLYGVAQTECGYANGFMVNPDYELVCNGTTGHAEAVLVKYDPSVLTLEKLLAEYFKTIDPTSRNRQGGDIGSQYRTGIYYTNPADFQTIAGVIESVGMQYNKPVITEVLPLTCFYKAEEYHQDYLEKHPNGYCHVDLSKLNDNQ